MPLTAVLDDEDSHFCLRCRTTIQGLENYINHRRQKCQTGSYETKTAHHQSAGQSNHTAYLSMARSTSSVGSPSSLRSYLNVPSKSSVSDPILSSSSNHMEEQYKARHSTDNSLVADLSVETSADDFMSHLGLCMVSSNTWAADIHSEEPLRADDFFSLLELQSCKGTDSGGRQRPRRSTEPIVVMAASKGEAESSVSTLDQQESTTFALVESTDLHSSHESPVVELSHQEEEVAAGDVTPPFNSPVCETTCPGSYDTDPVANSREADDISPGRISNEQQQQLPYPSRGKWMPGLKPRVIHKAGSSVEYHCKPCNRRLTGRTVFEKHLQSELHFKRTAQQLAESPVGPKYGLRGRNQRETATTTPSGQMDVVQVGEVDILEEETELVKDPWRINKRHNKKKDSGVGGAGGSGGLDKNANQRCPTCSVWVPKPLFGKHLVSRYHLSRCRKHPDRDRCVLDHIRAIVLEAPFQCRLCRFYCHSHADLLTHWKSRDHLACDLKDGRHSAAVAATYFCSLCRVGQLDCDSMRIHLESERHLDCVDIVNKSVAVVISKLQRIVCHLCVGNQPAVIFRYRMALNQHLASHHSIPSGMLSQHGGRLFACDHCHFKTLSNWSFTHHRFNCRAAPSDAANRYRCLVCNLGFPTKELVIRHRSTQEHRDVATRQRRSDSANQHGGERLRSCPHCYQTFADLAGLKEHSAAQHADLLPRCIRCAATFVLKQQLSAHRRAGCQLSESCESLAMACDLCSFRCAMKVDLLFHKAVEHRQPPPSHLLGDPSSGMSDASAVKYRCPECDQLYATTASLKAHLKSHTGELAFRCHHCGRHFERQDQRLAHIRQLHAPSNIKAKSMTTTTTTTAASPPLPIAGQDNKKKRVHSTSAGPLVRLDP